MSLPSCKKNSAQCGVTGEPCPTKAPTSCIPSYGTTSTAPLRELGSVDDPRFIEITDVLVRDKRAYVCTAVQGLLVYDIENPKSMEVLASVKLRLGNARYSRCQHVFLSGNVAYVTSRGDEIQPRSFLMAYDLSDLSRPKEVLAYSPEQMSLEGVAVKGAYLFLPIHQKGLLILKKEGSGVKLVKTLGGFSNAWGIALYQHYAVLADGDAGLKIVDIRTPEKAAIVGQVALSGFARQLVIAKGRAFVALGSSGFAIVDLQKPVAPKVLAQVPTPYSILDLELSGDTVFAANWTDIRAYDVSQPDKPLLTGTLILSPRLKQDSFTRNLAIGAKGDTVFVGEWEGLRAVAYQKQQTPILTVAERSLSFPLLQTGKSSAHSLVLKNEGQKTLELSVKIIGPDYSVKPSSLKVAPGKEEVLEVQFTSNAPGPSKGCLILQTNDPQHPHQTISLSGNQKGLRAGELHPDFSFASLKGKRYELKRFKGKIVILSYFATF